MSVRTLLAVVLVLVGTAFAFDQNQTPPPCGSPEFRQFDFWVGEWELSWPASETSEGKAGRGTNRIERALDECVITEHFDGTPSMDLRGMSVSTFNRRKGKWQQTWVDNSGSYLDFVGEFKDGQMILVHEAVVSESKKLLHRMVWKNIKADSLDWSWERSDDGGRTWKVLWPIHYQRKAAPPETDSGAIHKLFEEDMVAHRSGDPDLAASIYTDDVVWIPPSGSPIQGRAAIRERYSANFARYAMDLSIQSEETHVFGNWAFDRGVTTGTLTPKSGGSAIPLHDKYMAIVQRVPGLGWRIARLMWSPVGDSRP